MPLRDARLDCRFLDRAIGRDSPHFVAFNAMEVWIVVRRATGILQVLDFCQPPPPFIFVPLSPSLAAALGPPA